MPSPLPGGENKVSRNSEFGIECGSFAVLTEEWDFKPNETVICSQMPETLGI